MDTPELATYIKAQLQSGISADTIAAQLRTANWQEAHISAGFEEAQLQMAPTPVVSPISNEGSPQQQLPPPLQQGRMKTGWMLFKQSFSIIKNTPGLFRYVIISTVWSIGLFFVFGALLYIDSINGQLFSNLQVNGAEEVTAFTLPGLAVLAVWAIAQTVIAFFYATALSSHVLSIFRAQPSTYAKNIKLARTKIGSIITFSVIFVVVGFLINLLQRIRFVGWILSKIIGFIWSLATSFSVPLIADKEIGGAKAIKESILLFRQSWGETIVSRVSVGGLFFLIYFCIAIPVTIGLAIGLNFLFGGAGMLIAFILLIISIVIMGVIESLVTNVLNVALYYYATYKIIPPSFDAALLASFYRSKK